VYSPIVRKYFTRRCIGLHLLTLVLVPTFLLLGRWQYHAAMSGNTLSWVYTFEWPAFAVYALYVWWKLIHDQPTGWERILAAKERAAAVSSGVPVEEVPGWALDKELTKALTEASVEPTVSRMLSRSKRAEALEERNRRLEHVRQIGLELSEETWSPGDADPGGVPAIGASSGTWRSAAAGATTVEDQATDPGADTRSSGGKGLVDAEVLDVRLDVDEELVAYNRYLAYLNEHGPAKRW